MVISSSFAAGYLQLFYDKKGEVLMKYSNTILTDDNFDEEISKKGIRNEEYKI